MSGGQFADGDAERRVNACGETAFATCTDQVLGEVVRVGRLRPLHTRTLRFSVQCHRAFRDGLAHADRLRDATTTGTPNSWRLAASYGIPW